MSRKRKASRKQDFDVVASMDDALVGRVDSVALECMELAKGMRAKYTAGGKLETFLFELREKLTAMKATPVDAAAAGCHIHSRGSIATTLAFEPPSRVDMVGSYLLRTMPAFDKNVDLAVEMPAACFKQRDSKNFVYHDKRSLYASHVAKCFSRDDSVSSVSFQALRNDPNKQVLVLRPAGKLRHYAIRLHFVIAADVFNPKLLIPSHNNVRRRGGTDDAPQPATPRYNSSILEDSTMRAQLAAIHAELAAHPALVDSVLLLKAWLAKRGLDRSADGFNGFLMTAVIACLVQDGVITTAMAAHQVLRAVLRWLGQNSLRASSQTSVTGRKTIQALVLYPPGSQWKSVAVAAEKRQKRAEAIEESASEEEEEEEGSEMGEEGSDSEVGSDDGEEETGSDASSGDDGEEEEDDDAAAIAREFEQVADDADADMHEPVTRQRTLESMLQHFDCIILDATGRLNLAAHVHESACDELQHAAKVAYQLMSMESTGSGGAIQATVGFQQAMLQSSSLAESYDRIVHAAVPPCPVQVSRAAEHAARSGNGSQHAGHDSDDEEEEDTSAPVDADWDADVPVDGRVDAATTLSASQLVDLTDVTTRNGLCDASWETVAANRCASVLATGLGERITRLRILPQYALASSAAPAGDSIEDTWAMPRRLEWAVDGPVPEPSGLVVCLELNPEHAYRMVDRGPSPEQVRHAAAFKRLWGSKAELRRFQDGLILLSVVWQRPLELRTHIVVDVVVHLLHRHLHIAPASTSCAGLDLEAVANALQMSVNNQTTAAVIAAKKAGAKPASVPPPSSTNHTAAGTLATTAFDALSAMLRGANIPLKVQTVQFVGPEMRYTSPLPPLTHPLLLEDSRPALQAGVRHVSRAVQPLEVVIQLEPSAKWPDTVEALRATRTAFLVKLQAELESSTTHTSLTHDFLDVGLQGFLFRVRIFLDREVYLLEKASGKALGYSAILQKQRDIMDGIRTNGYINAAPMRPGTTPKPAVAQLPEARSISDTLTPDDAAREATRVYREGSLKPRLASTLHGLHMKHTSFGPAVRLAQQWISCHLLATHYSVEAIELLVAYVYLAKGDATVPHTASAAFIRFLRLIVEWDWDATPLLVDINREATPVDERSLLIKFKAQRAATKSVDPVANAMSTKAFAMYLVTPQERGHWRPLWNKPGPAPVVLRRTQVLAKLSLGHLSSSQHLSASNNPWSRVFTTPMTDYDMVIHIKPDVVAITQPAAMDALPATLSLPLQRNLVTEARKSLVAGVHPVEALLQRLNGRVGKQAMFFCGKSGGKFVHWASGQTANNLAFAAASQQAACTIGVVFKPQAFDSSAFDAFAKWGSVIGNKKQAAKEASSVAVCESVLDLAALVRDMCGTAADSLTVRGARA